MEQLLFLMESPTKKSIKILDFKILRKTITHQAKSFHLVETGFIPNICFGFKGYPQILSPSTSFNKKLLVCFITLVQPISTTAEFLRTNRVKIKLRSQLRICLKLTAILITLHNRKPYQRKRYELYPVLEENIDTRYIK